MAAIKISSKVDETVWQDLKELADESRRNISELLTEAICEYLRRRGVRSAVKQHLEDSIVANRRLGRLLGR